MASAGSRKDERGDLGLLFIDEQESDRLGPNLVIGRSPNNLWSAWE